ncbi:MFS transporter, SP family, general alpha glucoside:H+ symporter [Kwoniella heveanensis CBS 569]|uniref:MFS transporter, SP family, general alpha glucoside:H+ symporter n=1 Tax=Kwoniella heveanensis BCC8398 TaxID=1296120 RepID=A0A1B9GII5_9TREE|nr:MFS transporter, SP family, general alpha glucoside:H+ symporter [Kwoniella heveanensis BCC8398]OCF44538.1 MFS transporter, SP family, general alpha glucoside:H+ symporter [Kwoniella heveanensis CBS 569]
MANTHENITSVTDKDAHPFEHDENIDSKEDHQHLEDGSNNAPVGADWNEVRNDAIKAEEVEHAMSVRKALSVYRSAVLWSAAISLVIVMDGYDTGLLSSINGIPAYRQKYGHYSGTAKGGYQLNPAWQTAITEASIVGNFIGIFISSWFQDKYGYKRTIQIGLVLLTGFIFIVFYAPSVQVMFIGQLLCGMPWGAFSSSAVSYASEVTPISLRGYLTTYVNLCWVVGQFIAAGVLKAVADRTDQWGYKIPFAIQWVWPVPLFILATLAPESPWFYVRKGRLADAERSVTRLAKKGEDADPTQIVAMMVRTNEVELKNRPGTSYLDCFKGSDLRRTEIACFAWAAQIMSGTSFANQPAYFFQQAGFSTSNSFNLNLGAKALAFIGTCGSWITLTYLGRRPVFVIGLGTLTVLLVLVGAVAFPAVHNQNAGWGQAALIILWIFIYDFTVGPVTYAIVGEASSTRLRSKTVGLARNLYNVSRIIAGFLYTYQVNPTGWNWKGKAGFFWGGTCFVAFLWAYFRLPEFKGRSFRELDILFERNVPARKFKSTQVSEEDEQ